MRGDWDILLDVAAKRKAAGAKTQKAVAKAGAARKAPVRGRAAHVPSEQAKQRAEAIARGMPLVHFPANTRFEDWSRWGGLMSKAERGLSSATGRFERLRDDHVFTYGGPCCYHHSDKTIGDAVIYFGPAAETACTGCATPFDSGALEDTPARLQPFRKKDASEDKRWKFFESHRIALADWRTRFATWLAFAYDDPERYIESSPDRYAAGQPDRTEPLYLVRENGTRGLAKHGPHDCGDRRAWTWEVRVNARLPFEHITALHARFATFEQVNDFADELERNTGTRPRLRFLPADIEASTLAFYEAFYQESGSILSELMQ